LAVTTSLQLPDNPSPAGSIEFIALGGNGFNAPKGQYVIKNFATSGDATGGAHTLSMAFDPSYCAMVQYATFLHATVVSLAFKFNIVSSAVPAQLLQGDVVSISSTISTQKGLTWNPPAMILPGTPTAPTLSISVLNIDTAVLTLNASIFVYDIRAREDSRYQELVAARGGI